MKIAAVITEYDPFHLGHAYQLDRIREALDDDTAIIAIMSGHYTQRGEPALLDKYQRAAMAVEGGVDLVLELPFPYSASPAEFFAFGGVSIAESLGVVDHLVFGSESGDLPRLEKVAERLDSPLYREALLHAAKEKNNTGRAATFLQVYNRLFGDQDDALLTLPNEILAISYLQALKKCNSNIRPLAIRRLGNYHGDGEISPSHFASASYIRNALAKGERDSLSAHMPNLAFMRLSHAIDQGQAPCNKQALSRLLLSFFRLFPQPCGMWAEAQGGLYQRIAAKAQMSCSWEEAVSAAVTSKYTAARVRRAALFSFFGITPEDLRTPPAYTQALAMDKTGQQLLARMRRTATIPVLTKPAHYKKLSATALAQATCANRADSVYALLLPKVQPADLYIRQSPFCR